MGGVLSGRSGGQHRKMSMSSSGYVLLKLKLYIIFTRQAVTFFSGPLYSTLPGLPGKYWRRIKDKDSSLQEEL
jgi:hypothetical protein